MERPVLEAALRDAGANAMVADAENRTRAAKLKNFIVVYYVIVKVDSV